MIAGMSVSCSLDCIVQSKTRGACMKTGVEHYRLLRGESSRERGGHLDSVEADSGEERLIGEGRLGKGGGGE